MFSFIYRTLVICLFILAPFPVTAHHVLGRPAYSLSEDSNTPPSMAIETQIGDFYVTYMVFPAFPKSHQPGRLNLYIQGIDEGVNFTGEVRFTVVDDSFFPSTSNRQELIGVQPIDDGVYRQGFLFREDGKYLIRAHFDTDDAPYDIDFPLQVGNVSPIGPLAYAAIILVLTLLGANLVIGRRSQVAKFKMQARIDR